MMTSNEPSERAKEPGVTSLEIAGQKEATPSIYSGFWIGRGSLGVDAGVSKDL